MEPVTGAIAILGAASKASNSEAGKSAGRLAERVLGPTADALGEALGRYTEYRLSNVGRVLEKAEKKSRGRTNAPHPRVAHRILDEGSYVEDEVMAEYLSGVLAGSRGDTQDDRGVAWTSLISSMSAAQVRLHFMLYREWAAIAAQRTEIGTGMDVGRSQLALHLDLFEVSAILAPNVPAVATAIIGHAVSGLVRLDLLGQSWQYGPTAPDDAEKVPFPFTLSVNMSPPGMELYAWALGEPDKELHEFPTLSHVPVDLDLPRPIKIAFSKLPEPATEATATPGEADGAVAT